MRHDYEAIYKESGTRLWRVAYAVSGGRTDVADEAVAEAFARAIAHDASIRDPLPWIYRTTFRLVADELARDRKRTQMPELPSPDGAEGFAGLVGALHELSPNQRAAIVLRYVEDLDVSEVARRVGTSQATVRVHIHRGRKHLAKILGESPS